ncbi:DMT family transporter [Cereibacter azotoformans]|uniref:Drug/metabolite transporter (DMT)-like permease n=2 Tax=Cereibacter TaxID=1653176 RepID=A0A2T5K7D8_9RHOB|nr:DMT family transporter [Cereibacter azotoformans]AXQ94410.1 DMT family transporter [Cereibacter sphaeroides]MBO4170757.1 DMT family transporter [Cereibacter azotoformans]PTR18331.1 drug/metabolite transporter (DMT)-like permease [Cereibacter azotoformans]UIJ29953.1 DMT family transporter [Cereibacter azotoformans]ULB10648.1 DMT family transporter [Cereibacter azotoformans]
MQLSENLRGALAMSVAMAAFTVNDALMKAVTQTMPLFQAIALRGLVTLPMLLACGWASGGLRWRIPRPDRFLLALRAGADVLATVMYLTALMMLPLANLVAILQSVPLAVTLAAALWLKEPLGWRRLTAILIGFGGVLLIVRPGAEGFNLWSLLGLASVGCVVARDLSTRRLGGRLPATTVAFWTSAAVTAMGLVGLTRSGVAPVAMAEMMQILGAAVALIVGYLAIVLAMRGGDIGVVSPFRYTALVWAIGLGWLLFGNLPDGLTLAGSAIVTATGIFTLWRESRLRRRLREASVDITRDSPYTPPT